MKSLVAASLVVLALVGAGTAAAHNGNGWYISAAVMSKNIPQAYSNVTGARCVAPSTEVQKLYSAHSFVDPTGARRWDHLVCAIGLNGGGICIAVAHVTGQNWNSFYLGTFPYKGCTPYQLHRAN